jgi:hypothetical protein
MLTVQVLDFQTNQNIQENHSFELPYSQSKQSCYKYIILLPAFSNSYKTRGPRAWRPADTLEEFNIFRKMENICRRFEVGISALLTEK